MKRIILIILFITNYNVYCFESEREGTINFITSPLGQGAISIVPTSFITNRQDYINGGLTFTFDTPFNNIPRVLITIELNNPSSPTTTYSAVISSNSAASVTVLVYKISNGGTVAEAATNEVKVTIFAVDNF